MTEKASKYTGPAMFFHWIIFVLIAENIILHPETGDLPPEAIADTVSFHMGVGLIILVLMIARLAWRLTHPVPALPSEMPGWQQFAAKAVQWGLYGAVFFMVIVGVGIAAVAPYGADAFGFVPLNWIAPANEGLHHTLEEIHEALRFVIILLFLVHAGAAIYHAVAKRDGVFSSMLPW